MIVRDHFRAMGTEIEVLAAPAAAGALPAVRREFERLEALLSRFRPESELSRLNRDGQIEAGHDLAAVVTLALEARERTGGLFDPTVHDAVVAAGYDRTFDDLPADGPAGATSRCGGAVEIVGRRIRLAPGVRIDLGGIGKGYAADRARDLLAGHGACLVNAGGDLAATGSWPVGVDGGPTLELTDAALATSGRDRRRWQRGGEERHHLIDPRTGRPAAVELVRATVVAPTAVEAEVLATAAFLGAELGDVPRVLVHADGSIVLAGSLA